MVLTLGSERQAEEILALQDGLMLSTPPLWLE